MSSYRYSAIYILRNQLQCSRTIGRRWYSDKSIDPLRILFCGSDEFSVASLEALRAEQLRSPQLIKSIDVVCRPGKRVGRGLKQIREVPIKTTASKLDLRIHELDTFKGWTPDGPIDLIIAVSFGLFVPSRLLTAAKYGGVNVHPSLLPDLRGPAPIHHTLLSGRRTTGITLQTLHHKHFDHGIILDQTPAPGIPVPNLEYCTVPELLGFLAPKGAEMLINGIRNRVFVPPLKEVNSQVNKLNSKSPIHAAKVTPEDRHIKWKEWTWTDINRRQRVLSSLWNKALIPAQKPSADDPKNFQWKRVIFDEIEGISQDSVPKSQWLSLLPGVPFIPKPTESNSRDSALYVYTADGKLLRLNKLKVEGGKFNNALIAAQKAHMFSPKSFRATDAEFSLFYNPLC
ncbi:methionyl-tRNA formyltransferase family protein, putative [Talaromyces stipitatus ATCC 10500]|uniref:methionyl-tRNA formyltransferase n=1 Tax=Talaromyces stipitatus (strain ATCC 10500 / CBS 375.48 / QM 6759 / NRRL 1006) TaxID=441959 RepID=B8LTZ9_TALSN|nr:methionyl-tRNA formyltransferase family protein, putative [Talaromyces stipitatus ATCC 10500]EED23828.1 methionyl-tRNA formyltransferase family protein, putative [Talaromyces stipitatus ATCC 10500]